MKELAIKLDQLIEDVAGAKIIGKGDIDITNLEYDSRLIKPEGLFFAVKGYQVDGFDYLPQAIENGAVAVVGERQECPDAKNYVAVPDVRIAMSVIAAKFYNYPGKKLKVCGVTGTNGKTTTCYLIRSILKARNKTTGLITSQVYDTGKEQFTAERTTPESLDLQRLLYLMKKNHCVNAVIEASSHALSLHRLDNIDFRVGVFTNITRDHLDFHNDMAEYLAAKAELLKYIKGDLNYAVINLDVPEFRPLFGELDCSFMSYSLADTNADIYCTEYEIKPDSTIFNLVTPMGRHTVHLRLPGMFNLMNALAAATAGLASGIDVDTVVRGLEAAQPVPGRFEAVTVGQPFGVFVDFAHTPDALERLCQAAREIAKGKLLLMFGCGGDRDKGKRPMMGEVALNNADQIIITSDNPRSEDPAAIAEETIAGLDSSRFEIIIDRAEAVKKIISLATEGDVVLLAGKGAEVYQEIKGERLEYSEIETAKEVLASIGFQAKAGQER